MPADDELESHLIRAAQEGDSRAFDTLVERYQEYLFRLMIRACHHPDDAEDVTIAAFTRAYERLEQFEGRSSFVSWLGRIATRLCFRTREKKLPDTVADSPEGQSVWGQNGGASPEDELMRREMQSTLRAAVETLPEPDRTVLRLRDIDELSTKQTAEQTGLSESAVKSRLHRARKTLREWLGKELGITAED